MQAALVPQLNLPLLRHRVDESSRDSDASISLAKFPFQSSLSRSGAHSFAIASVSQKRPDEGVEINAKASAYASVKDVNDEEHLGENEVSPEEFSDQSVSPTPAERTEDATARKTAPYTLKRQQTESVMKEEDSFSDIYFVAIVAGCCAAGIFGVISAGFCFYRLQKNRKAALDVDYPAYGVTGPCKDVSSPNGDRKLAQSAQMYHYQHQKQQIIAVEKAGSTKNASASDVDSEEENEEGDYTVYECPGLAPTGEMEVKNPLFHEDSTPVSPPVLSAKSDKNTNN
ncbi:Neural proliferation differentiation and control protein 1, partial [Stegodyphus mimosarum]